ncbi:glutamyl-tRNA reductase [Helicobacter cetorum]|uniref:Glutamyl-tRNA reductase n=1 Tax=Helicobacter cetorum (strain ATCC BAA-540 / CCUG 52418 / MIT 99-5656) TaxID=1163745 RepID=I0ETH6_HELCM|nr:glutamyl-tRNA reductase [Helicobacter cetorum]AFI06245.1 glutamyl-tRNA reductase [Helicobacter cetorum MIT 99-5656]
MALETHSSKYFTLAFTHKHMSLEMREKLAINSPVALKEFLQTIKNNCPSIKECMVLSTCNRFEIYTSLKPSANANEQKMALLNILAHTKKMSVASLEKCVLMGVDESAVHHVLCVCSSLDSLVIGETQITGQMKNAYKFAFEEKFCSKDLTRLLHFAFKCAAKVRNLTGISKQGVSVSSVAVKEADDIFEKEKIKDRKALVIGLGESAQLVIKHLVAKHFEVLVLGRNVAKFEDFSKELEGYSKVEFKTIEHLEACINEYALLFSATSSPAYVVQNTMLKETPFKRFWFDLAVPRDIEKPILNNIFLYSVDDLEPMVRENVENRRESSFKAYEIVGLATIEFYQWIQSLAVEPLIKELRELARISAQKELQKAIKKRYVPKEYENNIEKILHNAFNTFLHHPTITLKKNAQKEESDVLVGTIKSLFNLDKFSVDNAKNLNLYKCEYYKE